MLRVVDTFRASLNSVVISSSAGKIEKSSASFVFIAIKRMMSATDMLITSRTSIRKVGTGMTIIMTMPITPTKTARSLSFMTNASGSLKLR